MCINSKTGTIYLLGVPVCVSCQHLWQGRTIYFRFAPRFILFCPVISHAHDRMQVDSVCTQPYPCTIAVGGWEGSKDLGDFWEYDIESDKVNSLYVCNLVWIKEATFGIRVLRV